ncbi:MAG: prepilin peptidase [Solobacterium sp.]|nr:prepilin peptidase [Solobacterium sp.]
MTHILILNLCSGILFQLYSDWYVQFKDLEDHKYRYYFALFINGFLTCLFLSTHHMPYLVLLIPVLYLAAYTDYRCGEIPDLSWILILFVVLLRQSFNWVSFSLTLLLTLGFAYVKWLGYGDVKLLSVWALLRGEHIIYALFFASFLALIIYGLRHKQLKGAIRFAPYLCIGFLLAEHIPFLH